MTITAKIIAASAHPQGGPNLYTLQLRYPKFIHGELMTHRVFSRNASSSRAIPVERLIQDVMDDPAMPLHWGKNQPGMQAREECDERVRLPKGHIDDIHQREWFGTRNRAWLAYRDEAVSAAQAFHQAGYHKQIVNRLLEPFCHINVVVTATEWSNFFALRCHADAQPEMRALAEAIRNVIADATPVVLQPGGWHLPYVTLPDDLALEIQSDWPADDVNSRAVKLSVARCARVSYLTQDGKTPTIEQDLALYDRLVGAVPLHASPCEHQATPDTQEWVDAVCTQMWANPHLHGNLRGWVQFRKTLPGEC